MFNNRPEFYDRTVRESAAIYVDTATLNTPDGAKEPGVGIFIDRKIVTVINADAAYRLAASIVDALEQLKTTTR